MEQYSSKSYRLIIGLCCIFVFFMAILPANAAKRSNGLAITLLISGVGMQVGSTFLNTSAENRYEDYLSASLQTDIQNYKDETVARKNASVIMSRVGYGCVGLAVLLSIFNQLESGTTETISVSQIPDNNRTTTNPLSYLSSRTSFNYRGFGESRNFSFRPHYDFQRQIASLQFQHRF